MILAALAVAFVATTSVPAAAQWWGGGWGHPHWGGGVGVGIGVGTPYAYAGPTGCTCPAPAYGAWGARVSTYAPDYGYAPGYAYAPGYSVGTTYAYDPGFVGDSYGDGYVVGSRGYATVGVAPQAHRNATVGVRTPARERIRTSGRMRSDVITRRANIRAGVERRADFDRRGNIRAGFERHDNRFVRTGAQGGFETRSTVGSGAAVQGRSNMRTNATVGQGGGNMRGETRGGGNLR
jgi:hypothetical protein